MITVPLWIAAIAIGLVVTFLVLIVLGINSVVDRLRDLNHQNNLLLKELERIREASLMSAGTLDDRLPR